MPILTKPNIDNIQDRVRLEEWNYLIKKYPRVAFNAGLWKTPKQGFSHIVVAEPYIEIPKNWEPDFLLQYEAVVTYNRTFAAEHLKHLPKVHLMSTQPRTNSYFYLDRFADFPERINGIICMNKLNFTKKEGDIYYLREKIMTALPTSQCFEKHVFSRHKWGGEMYRGYVAAPYHSHEINLKKLNEYKFCLCFESTHHPTYSYDFVTEKIFNCFKAKVVPVYLGCWNIEELIPPNLYIDFRDYAQDLNALAHRLETFTEEEFVDMTERAHTWEKSTQLGAIDEIESILKNL